jgi:hypothetical protein
MEEQTQDEKPEHEETMKDLEVPDEQADDVKGGRKAGKEQHEAE